MAISKYENYLLQEVFKEAKIQNDGKAYLPMHVIVEVIAKSSRQELDLFFRLCKDYQIVNVPKYSEAEIEFLKTIYPFIGELQNGLAEVPKEIITSFCFKYPKEVTFKIKDLCDKLNIKWYPFIDWFYDIKDFIYLDNQKLMVPREAYIKVREGMTTLRNTEEFDDMCKYFNLTPETKEVAEVVDRNKYVTIFDHPEDTEKEDKSQRRTYSDLELDELIKDKIMPKVNSKFKITVDSLDYIEMKTIPFNALVKFRFNAEELDYVMNYLQSQDILVRGFSPDMTKYPNYEYMATYKSGSKKVFDFVDYDLVTYNHFLLFNRIKDKIEELQAEGKPVDQLLEQKEAVRNEIIFDVGRLFDFCLFKNRFNTEDDRQNGFIILQNLIERFDMNRGARFSTYLFFALPLALKRVKTDEEGTIRFPAHIRDELNRFARAKEYFESKGITPTINDYSLYLGWSDDKVEEYMKYARANEKILFGFIEDQDLPDYSLEENSNYSPESMEDLSDPSVLSVDIPDEDFDLDDVFVQKNLREALDEALDTLTPREKGVLELRFGLADGIAHTLDEIASYYNVTRERVRQIEAKALKKLRHPSRVGKLKGLL